MNLTLYKRRKLRQKPHILTIEQSRELGQLAGNKLLKHVTDPGLVSLFFFMKENFFDSGFIQHCSFQNHRFQQTYFV